MRKQRDTHCWYIGWKELLFIVLFILPYFSFSQVTFLIDKVPAYTPLQDTLFLAGSFNEWNPGDTAWALNRQNDGTYQLSSEQIPTIFEFKITRGDWKTVEGSKLGQSIDNRIHNVSRVKDTVWVEVLSWEDMTAEIPFSKKIKINVIEIPGSTPDDASIYIAGNFNEWNPGDRKYKLNKESNDTYTVWIPIRQDTVEYKFSRGTWSSIEGAANGRARPNRVYVSTKDQDNLVKVKIKTWEDLSGDPINTYTFFLLLAAFQGLLLIIAINTIQDNNIFANRILSVLILLISIALIGRVSTYGREIFQWQPRLLLLPDIIYFIYGPIFLWYIQTLLMIPAKNNFAKLVNFIPALIQLVLYIPILLIDTETFISRVVDMSLKKYFIASAFCALFFNLFYWWKCHRIIRNHASSSNDNLSFEQDVAYLQPVIKLKLLCLMVWALTYIIGGTGWLLDKDWVFITDKMTDAIWIILSLTVFFLGYFAMKQPEIFKLKEREVVEEENKSELLQEESPIEQDTEMIALKEKLEQIMQKDKPYLNPRLALSDLAEMADTNLHTLSRLINEGFNKNFYDFVNSYRVEEFKKRIIMPDYQNQTFLAVAFSVGFNSKTAFNRSFKKLTNTTPRKFLQAYEASQSA